MMKRILHIGMWIFTMVLLTGCSKFEPKTDAISVDKDGKVIRVFADEFVDDANQPYSVEDIQSMMEQELNTYNRKFGVDHVILEECVLEEGILTIRIVCDEAKYYVDYCGYYNDDFTTEETDVELFTGSADKAQEYDGDILLQTFRDTKGELVDAQQALAGEKDKVMILNEPVEAYTPGNILYVSENVEILGKKQARVVQEQQWQKAYIIYK